VKYSLKTTTRWSSLVLAMGVAGIPAHQAQAAIYWPGGTDDTTSTDTDYNTGYNEAQDDCRLTPIGCGVKIYPMTKDQGYGETEPNDHIRNADGLLLGRFYHANTLGEFDEDWYYVVTDKPNQKLTVYFLADAGNFVDTAGWVIQVRDLNGNVIAAFDSQTVAAGGEDPGDNPDTPASVSPVDSAKITEVTLGNIGTYYISVKSQTDAAGTLRGYNIAANLKNTGQITPNPGDNFFDTETEPNDTFKEADILRSNVIMSGVFDRTLIKTWVPPKPAEYETAYFYKLCDPTNLNTIPAGNDSCSCDLTASPFPPNPNFNPQNPHSIFDIDQATAGIQLPADLNYDPNFQCPAATDLTDPNDPHYCNFTKSQIDSIPLPLNVPVDAANPPLGWSANYQLSVGDSCYAQQVQKAGTGTDSGQWTGTFGYNPDVYVYHSDGNEQLRLQICVRSECEFSKVHVRVRRMESGQVVGSSTAIMEGPLEPGQTVDLGAALAGDYYIEFTPEPTGNIDTDTGEEDVTDLTGPYDLLLMGTRFSTTAP
jgi:hypothetical protein